MLAMSRCVDRLPGRSVNTITARKAVNMNTRPQLPAKIRMML
jgi:hypothetical protein